MQNRSCEDSIQLLRGNAIIMPPNLTKSNPLVRPSILEEILQKNQLKLYQLADELGINKSCITKWSTGKAKMQLSTPQWQTIMRLAKQADIAVENLPEDWYIRKIID